MDEQVSGSALEEEKVAEAANTQLCTSKLLHFDENTSPCVNCAISSDTLNNRTQQQEGNQNQSHSEE